MDMHKLREKVEAEKLKTEINENIESAEAENVSENLLPADAVKDGIETAVKKTILNSKDNKDLARDLTYLKGASDLQSNEDFTQSYQRELGKQLLKDLQDEGKRQGIINGARKQEERNARDQAFYDSCKPIFKLLNIDAPFGIVAMSFTVFLLFIPFLAVSLIQFAINSLNEIFKAIADFTKPARIICTTLLVVAISVATVLIILLGVDKIFGTHIIGKIVRWHQNGITIFSQQNL